MSKSKLTELQENLEKVILESEADYGTVMTTLSRIGRNYIEKGRNLLNNTKIQEVSDECKVEKNLILASSKEQDVLEKQIGFWVSLDNTSKSIEIGFHGKEVIIPIKYVALLIKQIENLLVQPNSESIVHYEISRDVF